MEFRVLGPLELWDEGGEVSLSGPKPRALLAVLLLHANEVVPTDRLTVGRSIDPRTTAWASAKTSLLRGHSRTPAQASLFCESSY